MHDLFSWFRQPIYNKDDFFDSLSCNSRDHDSQSGRLRYSEQIKIDTEVMWNLRLGLTYIIFGGIMFNSFADLWCRHLVTLRGIVVAGGVVVHGAVVVDVLVVVIMEGGTVMEEEEGGVACPVVIRWRQQLVFGLSCGGT